MHSCPAVCSACVGVTFVVLCSVVAIRYVSNFIMEYFDQNPLSRLGVIVMRNGTAEKVSDLTSRPQYHIQRLKDKSVTGGDASLQNALELAHSSLKYVRRVVLARQTADRR